VLQLLHQQLLLLLLQQLFLPVTLLAGLLAD
jgi:hypothetical protein